MSSVELADIELLGTHRISPIYSSRISYGWRITTRLTELFAGVPHSWLHIGQKFQLCGLSLELGGVNCVRR
jgi:hypothetical protein